MLNYQGLCMRRAIWPVCLVICLMLASGGCRAERDVERMRIIVTLKVADMGDDFRESERRGETRALRDSLVTRLDSGKVRLLETMELSGQVVLEIDADALAGIENAPEVRAVSRDRLYSPSAGEQP